MKYNRALTAGARHPKSKSLCWLRALKQLQQEKKEI